MQWNNWILSSLSFLMALPLIAGELPPVGGDHLARGTAAARSAAGVERGMWVWLHPDLETEAGHERLMAFCREHGIARIFVEVTFSGSGEAMTLDRQDILKALLKRAGEAGVIVEALDGHQEMSLEKCRADTLQRLEVLLAFHAEQPAGARFAGLHYDMEPYLGERWRNGDEAGVMRETLETMAAIRERANRANAETSGASEPSQTSTGAALTVAYDIPSWYDRHPETLSIEFNGARKNFHEHIQDLSDFIGIMSYRREASRVIEICEAEFAYGEKVGKKVYAGLETGRLKEEPEITFYGAASAEFFETLRAVDEAKKDSPAYGGVFLHYYESLRELLDPR